MSDETDPIDDIKAAVKFFWGLTAPGAIINIAKRSAEAEARQNGAVYEVVLGSAPTAQWDDDGSGWERYQDPRNEIAYRRLVRPAKTKKR